MDGEPRGAIRERGKKLEARMMEGVGGVGVPRPGNSTHPTSRTSPGHTVTHKGTLWAMCERQLAHVLCSVFPSREA